MLGKGEKKNRLSRGRQSILADLFEAIIGAIYLDGGIDASREFIFAHFAEDVQQIVREPQRNWKADLQDYAQKKYQKIPTYKVMKEVGPDHSKIFHVSAFIGNKLLGSGFGPSKKEAQQAAASEALYNVSMNVEPGEVDDKREN